jgi:DinB family protein
MATSNGNTQILTPETLLEHWQGHRRVTRRVIEAFPEDKLFTFSVGSMRPFAQLALEFLKMAEPIVCGVATGKWVSSELTLPQTKAELLALWDEATIRLNTIWPTIPPRRFREVDKAFGMWEGEGIATIMYAIDNEIHHRGQGYVYLRALGIEPPAFYERN